MAEHGWTWTLRRELPSRRGAHLTCMEEILAALKQLSWDGRDLFGIEMALEESLTNAIRHGNRLDEKKRVYVDCRASRERFWLQVSDEGLGFRPHAVPDSPLVRPDDADDVKLTSGHQPRIAESHITHKRSARRASEERGGR